MSTGENQPSTIKAVYDTAVAGVQSAIGTITGNTVDQRQAADRKDHADAEKELSRAGAKVGPVNLSTAGATIDNKDRREGAYNQSMGSVKEATGNLIGSPDLVREGRTQNQEGQGQKAAGQLKNYTQGGIDRMVGAAGSVAAAAVGNEDAQKAYQRQHDQGKTNVRGVEAEVSKE